MRYEYVCKACRIRMEKVQSLSEEMTVPPCPQCQEPMKRLFTSPILYFAGRMPGGRSVLSKDRPTNQEYQAYKEWESSGGDPGTQEHHKFLQIKGEE
jgi:putative FmdB family regulatory protein